MKALLIKTNGSILTVEPKNGVRFMLEELQEYVGGLIDIQDLPDGRVIYLNDEGKMIGLPKNSVATEIWKRAYPISEYPDNNDELIVGDILLFEKTDDELQDILAELTL